MAQKKQKSVIEQLQAVGEDALGKITKNPATRSALQGASQLKDKGGKVFAGFESIEKRLAAIEKRLTALEGQGEEADDDAGRARRRRRRPLRLPRSRTRPRPRRRQGR